uniref:Resistance to inhibitors of cholinesterase protein 3 N-terminal domain-containing protein n=1 Tax=Syphacia muris TaxID=451379 RepID=A0A0N5AAI9_9BILA
MGGGSSSPLHPRHMLEVQQYPDMNAVFSQLPKMMQVADDMHRMTEYMMDLRNMTFALVCSSLILGVLYLITKIIHYRRKNSYRKHALERRLEQAMSERAFPRHLHYSGYQGFCEPWPEPRPKTATSIDMDKIQLSGCAQNDNPDRMSESSPHVTEARNLANGLTNKV